MIKFKKDFNNYFKTIGIKPGDTIYLGLNLGKTFLPYRKTLFKKENLLSIKNKCCELILNSLKELVGNEGTIIVPTFSFSFIKQKKFDIKNTSSTLGFFENFFLKQKKIKRSPHPLYSISVWGKNKKIIEPCGRFSPSIAISKASVPLPHPIQWSVLRYDANSVSNCLTYFPPMNAVSEITLDMAASISVFIDSY